MCVVVFEPIGISRSQLCGVSAETDDGQNPKGADRHSHEHTQHKVGFALLFSQGSRLIKAI